MAEPVNLFDPAHYAAVRRPLASARHLPPWCYTSEAFFNAEQDRVFCKVWNFIGRDERIPNRGDYFTVEVAGTPLIVLRDRAGGIRAFSNSCRHRGARLLDGAGSCPSHIACPYHSWTYTIDGRLAAAPGMEGIDNFDKADYGLLPVRLESWEGFLFVNLDPEAESLNDYLGELPQILSSYRFRDMICTRRQRFEVASNWKLIAENAMEDYHTATVHSSSIGMQKIVMESGRGNWEAGHYATEKSIATLPGEKIAFPWIEGLTGKSRTGTYFALLYPCTTVACNQDGMFWLELYPRSAARTELIVGHAFPRATVARDDFEEVVQRYYGRCDLSIPEDNRIAERQQRGLASPLAVTGRVSLHEVAVHALANWLLDRLLPAGLG